ncbi:hypothetical protein FKP32DRAFT_1204708 [Trametes sanguinea]|nr:hypothetical protein FKP32DRAFT_1204708 [Trametes sanguinea]
MSSRARSGLSLILSLLLLPSIIPSSSWRLLSQPHTEYSILGAEAEKVERQKREREGTHFGVSRDDQFVFCGEPAVSACVWTRAAKFSRAIKAGAPLAPRLPASTPTLYLCCPSRRCFRLLDVLLLAAGLEADDVMAPGRPETLASDPTGWLLRDARHLPRYPAHFWPCRISNSLAGAPHLPGDNADLFGPLCERKGSLLGAGILRSSSVNSLGFVQEHIV